MITVTLTNRSGGLVRLNTLYLAFPSIEFEVRDEAGKPVLLGPPPVPPLDNGTTGRETSAPG
jgi:hypothetical protein